MPIFNPRLAFKPFEYPDVAPYKDAIRESHWTHKEWSFQSDVQDFHVKLVPHERNAIKNTLLAIAQVEIGVKEFWLKVGDRFPKPEIKQVGATFGESEVRHADAYSHLVEVLGLNDDFSMLLQNPVIAQRVDYLSEYIKNASNNTNEEYTLTLALFSLFIENVSLFSQFLIIRSFWKHRNLLKDIDNVVEATQKEEQVHAMFGAHLLRIIRTEHPAWFDNNFYEKIARASKQAYQAECRIIEWIFEEGELDFLSMDTVKEFTKDRFNQSLLMIDGPEIFPVSERRLKEVRWFDEDMLGQVHTDFFNKKSTAYAKHSKAITAGDLFD